MHVQLAAEHASIRAAVSQIATDTAAYRSHVHTAHTAMSQALNKHLTQSRAVLAADMAALRSHYQEARKAMIHAQAKQFAAGRSRLAADRARVTADTAAFRNRTRQAHAAMTEALSEKLTEDRTHLTAEVIQVRADAVSMLREIQTDHAGAVTAWRMLSTPSPQPPHKAPHAAPKTEARRAKPASAEPERPVAMSEATLTSATVQHDELTALHGIGPAIQEKLYATGITTYAQLAAATPDAIHAAIGSSVVRLVNLEELIAQAGQLARRNG
jgi:predicted flap endonuclease-1-like 5' DNA nuclease